MLKKAKKELQGLLGFGMIGGLGSAALGKVPGGGAAVAHGQAGLGTAMSFSPVMGTRISGGMVMRSIKKLDTQLNKGRKKRTIF